MVKIADVVIYVDPAGTAHKALVAAVWPGEYGQDKPPGLNLVYISDNPERQDSGGRITERAYSIVHKSMQPAAANYWEELLTEPPRPKPLDLTEITMPFSP